MKHRKMLGLALLGLAMMPSGLDGGFVTPDVSLDLDQCPDSEPDAPPLPPNSDSEPSESSTSDYTTIPAGAD